MMRHFLIASSAALLAPAAFADTFTAPAAIETVTIYPQGATVERVLTLDVPAGAHQIIVPDLPANLRSEGLRLAADAGRIGAVSLARGRLPVTADSPSPEIAAAEAEVERLTEDMRARVAAIAAMRLRVTAAEDQIAFLKGLSQTAASESLNAAAISDILALTQMVGQETLTARQTAFEAEQEALSAERDLEDLQDALRDARQALIALRAPDEDSSVLTFTLGADVAQTITVTVSSVENGARWAPVYDMRLTTGDDPSLILDRGVVVSQWTGQDWTDVDLVLSTARPGEQSRPGTLWPQLRRILSPEELERERIPQPRTMSVQSEMFAGALAADAIEAPVLAVEEEARLQANFSGANVSYDYGRSVDIRDGVEDLRLSLDTLTFDAETWAAAVPSRDTTAFLMGAFTNTSNEVLLPGETLMLVDGAMVGFDYLDLVAAGAEAEMGFGPIDGVRLTREVPSRSKGDAGVFTSANAQRENVILKVENLTARDWNIRLHDQVPYSEQDDLEISYQASSPPTVVDPDGQRGLLAWHFALPAGDSRTVTLDTTLTWPEDHVLR